MRILNSKHLELGMTQCYEEFHKLDQTCENRVKILLSAILEKKSQDLCYSIVF